MVTNNKKERATSPFNIKKRLKFIKVIQLILKKQSNNVNI